MQRELVGANARHFVLEEKFKVVLEEKFKEFDLFVHCCALCIVHLPKHQTKAQSESV